MTYCLMTGTYADVRIHGWVALAQQGQFGAPTPDQAWAVHRESLIAAARAAGFQPNWETNRDPAGPAFRQWRYRFLEQHRY